MTAWGAMTDIILIALKEHGPMTRAEIQQFLGPSQTCTGKTVGHLNRPHAKTPKRIYVLAWVMDAEGCRRYPRAVYALGDKPDKPKPKSNRKLNRQRSVANLAARARGVSVFHQGLTVLEMRRAAESGTTPTLFGG